MHKKIMTKKNKKLNEIFEVEEILDKKTETNGKIFYLIKWKNYDSDHNTWGIYFIY
jgi:hypothetical protein